MISSQEAVLKCEQSNLVLREVNVDSGFNQDFMRYGGAERSLGVREIFRHRNEAWSMRLSPISNVVRPYNIALTPIYIPGKM